MGTALITDLYELTMAQSYLEQDRTGHSVFSLFVRNLPKERNFLVSCGLEILIEQINRFRFGSDDLAYISGLGIFSDSFLDWLKSYRFSGSISAIPEGTIVFQNEPILQIEGALPEIQILETLALNCIQYQTMAASKAARIMCVARNRTVVDFGFRRSHMADAGVHAARAAYIAGFAGTSNLEAGKRFGIPVVGTMAHSYIMVFPTEEAAFRSFAASFPERTVLLLDTFDTLACTRKVVSLAENGLKVIGVRIDSGDIPVLVPRVREMLDAAGLRSVQIFISSGVDEYAISTWLDAGVPIDSFGVGTHFITASDAPFLDMVYKLVEYEGRPVFKTSPGKATIPYKRQVVRRLDHGMISSDSVVRAGENDHGAGLIKDYILDGVPLAAFPSLEEIRKRLQSELSRLPPAYTSLEKKEFPVHIEM